MGYGTPSLLQQRDLFLQHHYKVQAQKHATKKKHVRFMQDCVLSVCLNKLPKQQMEDEGDKRTFF